MAKSRTKAKTKSQLLDELQRKVGGVGGALPEEYRRFMTTFAGELPQRRSFKIARDDQRELNALWPLKAARGGGGSGATVGGGWGLLEGKEAHLLVIGDDGSGNWVCLAVAGNDRGKIFFVDHDYSPGERKRLTKLADSFDQFMATLR